MTAELRTALAFNDAITRRDLSALRELMTEDHTFVDSDANVVAGAKSVLDAWQGFFAAFPDYRNVWEDVRLDGDAVIATGRSVCATEPALDGAAIWTATLRGDRVAEWRVYEDTPENRSRLWKTRNSQGVAS
jgi:ketosteroid isomerase-like protein